jgi:cytoskeletal protein RodZ
VIVAAVSEMLNRPADAVSELRRQRRTLVQEARMLETARVRGEEPSPLRGAPEFVQGPDAPREPSTNGSGDPRPYTVHGRRRISRRVLHPKVWLVTGVVAFLIAVAALTLPELIFGGAVATGRSTTFFGGGSNSNSNSNSNKQDTNTTTTPSGSQTQTQTTGTQTAPSQSQPQPQTTTTPSQTPPTDTSTSPSGGVAPPSSTDTSTAPAPSGAATPASP